MNRIKLFVESGKHDTLFFRLARWSDTSRAQWCIVVAAAMVLGWVCWRIT